MLIIPWKAQKRNRKKRMYTLVFTKLIALAKDKLLRFAAITVHKRIFRRYGEMGKAATLKPIFTVELQKGIAYKF